jgi:hypothetical protein
MDDDLARDVIERAEHRNCLGLPRRRHTQPAPTLAPGTGEVAMSQRPRSLRPRRAAADRLY